MIRTRMVHAGLLHTLFQPRIASDEGDYRALTPSRLTRALLLLPVFLCMGFYTLQPNVSALVSAGLIFFGSALVLFALQALTGRLALMAGIGFSLYSVALATLLFQAPAENTLLIALVLGLPLEIWLVTRRFGFSFAGIIISAALMLISGLLPAAATASLPSLLPVAAGMSLLFIYLGSLFLRVMRVPVRVIRSVEEAPAAFADTLDALVIRLDTEGYIQSLTQRSAMQLGVEQSVLGGTALLDRVHVTDRVHYLRFLSALKSEQLGLSPDIRLRCVDNATGKPQIFYESFRFEGSLNKETAQNGFLLIARSNAREQQMLAQNERQAAEIDELQTARDRFLGTVTHELRTPLNSIIGFSDLLLHDMAGPLQSAKQREYVDLIRKSGNHLLDVVNGVLEATRLEAGRYPVLAESFALRESVALCNAMLTPQASQKGISLFERIDPSVTEIVADRRAMQQVLINLVSNAIKFTDQGGCVTIDVSTQSTRSGLCVKQSAPILVIAVTDTGIGLEQSEIDRLCLPFSQIDNVHTRLQEGSGLGLYLVKGLIALHGGEMNIVSAKGKGTTVRIMMPLDGAALSEPQGAMSSDNITTLASPAVKTQPVRDRQFDSHELSVSQNSIVNVQPRNLQVLNMPPLSAERTYDDTAKPQQGQTQGDLHAQKRKTA